MDGRLSAEVTHSLNKTLCCGHIPKYFLMLSMSVWMSYPLMRAVPDVGGKSPVRIDLHKKEGHKYLDLPWGSIWIADS